VADHPGSVSVSSLTGDGIDLMLATLGDRLRSLTEVVELFIGWNRGDVLASVHREGQIVSTADEADGQRTRVRLSDASLGRLREFLVTTSPGGGE